MVPGESPLLKQGDGPRASYGYPEALLIDSLCGNISSS